MSTEDKDELLQQAPAGSHYKHLKIEPVEYNHVNNIPFAEGSIIKYVTRWKDKGGIEDLKKARFYIEYLIQQEEKA
jgi:hypothetical protein